MPINYDHSWNNIHPDRDKSDPFLTKYWRFCIWFITRYWTTNFIHEHELNNQEVFEALVLAIVRVRNSHDESISKVTGYLSRVILRQLSDLAKDKRRPKYKFQNSFVSLSEDPILDRIYSRPILNWPILLSNLSDRERQIIRYCSQGESLSPLAEELNISRARIHQVKSKLFKRLREAIEEQLEEQRLEVQDLFED
jgi:RNA polymerase sigma factor (sigma-70 family)